MEYFEYLRRNEGTQIIRQAERMKKKKKKKEVPLIALISPPLSL